MAWPILLMLSCLAWRSAPSASNASSSKKHQIRPPDARNSRSLDPLLLVGGEHACARWSARSSSTISIGALRAARHTLRATAKSSIDQEAVAVVAVDLRVGEHGANLGQRSVRVRFASVDRR